MPRRPEYEELRTGKDSKENGAFGLENNSKRFYQDAKKGRGDANQWYRGSIAWGVRDRLCPAACFQILTLQLATCMIWSKLSIPQCIMIVPTHRTIVRIKRVTAGNVLRSTLHL